jgi:hypothetical protein
LRSGSSEESVELDQLRDALHHAVSQFHDTMAALNAGDGGEHDRLIAQAAQRFADCYAVLLAHFSTARAMPAVRAVLDRPVLTSPGSAVVRLKAILAERQ